jgi:phage terminase large subunit GpA-like protein
LQWPLPLKPSEWAERYRVLGSAEAAEPGPWRNARTPYLAGVMDATVEPGVEEVVFVSGTQVGKSEAGRNLLGYWIDNNPGPTLWVLPSEQATKEAVEERLKPLILNSPALRRHLPKSPDAITQRKLTLATMPVYLGWAGSPQALATRPAQRVVFDEIDKYPQFAGKEADPVSLGEERTKTYGHRRTLLKTSTPTTRTGPIWIAFELCTDRRYFNVPCPHCGEYQRLVFAQLKWPKQEETGIENRNAYADAIKTQRLAYYECIGCKKPITDTHKPKMLEAGKWISEGSKGSRVGFHLSSLYSPWVKFGDMAAKWIEAAGDAAKTMNFRNSWLAEPFEVKVTSTQPSKIRDRVGKGGPAFVVPTWATQLIATADVQQDRMYFAVRAWGYGWRSKLVHAGVARSWDELYGEAFDRQYHAEGGGAVRCERLVVDNGYRKAEVDAFALRDPDRIHTAKGMSTYSGALVTPNVEKSTTLIVFSINTMQSKDQLSVLINHADESMWSVHDLTSDDYCSQVVAEEKVMNPQTKQMEWKEKSSGAPNHFLDCEAMQVAVAAYYGAGVPVPEQFASTTAVDPTTKSSNWVTGFKGRY